MSEAQIKDFLGWYEGQKGKRFDNKRVIEAYSQDNVRVLRQTCQNFRQEFIVIGNIVVFLKAITSAAQVVFKAGHDWTNSAGLIHEKYQLQ
jgi:hypothetical protein